MTQVTIHEAKTHLSRLIEKVLRGEEVVIAKRDRPLVRLVQELPAERGEGLGALRGLVVHESPDCWESDEWAEAPNDPLTQPPKSKKRRRK